METFNTISKFLQEATRKAVSKAINNVLDFAEANREDAEANVKLQSKKQPVVIDFNKLLEERYSIPADYNESRPVEIHLLDSPKDTPHIATRREPISSDLYEVKQNMVICKKCRMQLNTINSIGSYTSPAVIYSKHARSKIHEYRASILILNPDIDEINLKKTALLSIRNDKRLIKEKSIKNEK